MMLRYNLSEAKGTTLVKLKYDLGKLRYDLSKVEV